MSKRKLAALLLPALVVVLSGLSAASASAVVFSLEPTECTGGTGIALCWSEAEAETSPLLELKGKQSETASGGVSTLTTAKIKTECKTTSGSGTIVQEKPLEGGKTTIEGGLLLFLECVVAGPEELKNKCQIKEGLIETATLSGELTSETNVTVKPTTGTTLATINIESKTGQTCPATIAGVRTVTGEQEVTINHPGVHELTKSGSAVQKSKLKFLSEAAELVGEITLSFTGLEDWVDISKTA